MSPLFPATLHILGERLQQRREQLASQLRQRLHQNYEQQEMALFNNYAIDLDRAEACQLSDTDIALLSKPVRPMELRATLRALRERPETASHAS